MFHVDSDDEVEPYLVVGMALCEQNIHHGQLVNEAVALKFLSDARANDRDGEGYRVHGLHLGCLLYCGILVSESSAGLPFPPILPLYIGRFGRVHCRKLASLVSLCVRSQRTDRSHRR